MDSYYNFVYRGALTEEALDKAGRRRHRRIGAEELARTEKALSFEMLDQDLVGDAKGMAIVYTAIHAFENTIRQLVQKAMAEKHEDEWWSKVPERIQKRVQSRMEEDAKFRWHGRRGATQIHYCDFGDMSSIIVTNWDVFEDVLTDLEWAKAILSALEKSRNILMHGGLLSREDIERIGVNVRDWIRQTG